MLRLAVFTSALLSGASGLLLQSAWLTPSASAARCAKSGLRMQPAAARGGEDSSGEDSTLPEFDQQIGRFASAGELAELRQQMALARQALDDAIDREDFVAAATHRDELSELVAQDPVEAAAEVRKQLKRAVESEHFDDATALQDQIRVLRRFLPQYNLAGLWKGNYPNHGEELIRVRYDGDTMYAIKVLRAGLRAVEPVHRRDWPHAHTRPMRSPDVPPCAAHLPLAPAPRASVSRASFSRAPVSRQVTGDEHVPSGEVTFQAELAEPFVEAETPVASGSGEGEDLVGVRVEVVSLSPDGAPEQREVERYHGEGRIAARGFQHAHFVPGQLFLMDTDVLGFLWLPLGTLVVFNRVSEEEERDLESATASPASLNDLKI